MKILPPGSAVSFMFCHPFSLEVLKVSVSNLLSEDIDMDSAERQSSLIRRSTPMREVWRGFFLDAQGARYVFLHMLKVVSLPFSFIFKKLRWGL